MGEKEKKEEKERIRNKRRWKVYYIVTVLHKTFRK